MIVFWGSNARETHPIFFHHVLRGVRNGAKLYVVDPRQTSSARWADGWLGINVGSDIALANAVGREILAAGLENREFVIEQPMGFEDTGGPSSPTHWSMPKRRPASRHPSFASSL